MKQTKAFSRSIRRNPLLIALFGCMAMMAACATTSDSEFRHDPYERLNRKIYAFNDAVDDYIAEPIADAYQWLMPEIMQTGISNFYRNLDNINVVFNDLLQAKFAQAGRDTGRFFINTTVGMGGFLDAAKDLDLLQNEEDFEQTLAVWGVPEGSFLVLPFVGPITVRGIPGAVVDTAANPLTYVGQPLLSNFIGGPIQGLSLINKRANAEGAIKFIDEAALDPYVFTRESFLQWRRSLATDGKVDSSIDFIDLEDIEDQ